MSAKEKFVLKGFPQKRKGRCSANRAVNWMKVERWRILKLPQIRDECISPSS